MKATAITDLLFENRSRSRFKLNLDCRVYKNGAAVRGEGVQTLDISKGGISIRWSDREPPPRVGDRLTIEVGLPAHPRFGAKCMFFQTEVVRVRHDPEAGTIVAAKACKTGFRRPVTASRHVN